MDRATILEKLGTVIREGAGSDVDWAAVTESTSLESFGVDSLAVLDLIFDLEDSFDIKIEPKQMLAMKTAGDLVQFIDEQTD
jgi:acyl carrier protein